MIRKIANLALGVSLAAANTEESTGENNGLETYKAN